VLGETEAMSVSGRISVERIVIELEIPGDSRSLFRLRLDNKIVGENFTAVQTHLLPARFSTELHCRGQRRESLGRKFDERREIKFIRQR
jgi:hypothetical protein